MQMKSKDKINRIVYRGGYTMKRGPLNLLCVFCLMITFGGCSGATTKTNIAPSITPNVQYVPAENTVVLSGIRRVAGGER